jgi:sulfoxide reductase catalytic subunit YedY
MLIKSRMPWALSERDVTPERLYVTRRRIMAAGAAGLSALALPGCGRAKDATAAAEGAVTGEGPGALSYRTTDYAVADPLTAVEAITGYNNFYEFGDGKSDPARYAHAMTTDPWSVSVEGLAGRTGTYAVEDLVDFNALEERIYRLRCVERWSMVIPWIGVPLSSVLAKLEPSSDAKYVAFETYANRDEMRGLRSNVLEWPYLEGLRMDEAMHPLTLMAVGLYGRTLLNQNGAPMRLVVPWKYGYKSIKSIVRITFTEEEPPTAWSGYSEREYGFYSNVNPEVRHPRWSQEFERPIGDDPLAQRATEIFNGYGDEVAALYAGMDLERFH